MELSSDSATWGVSTRHYRDTELSVWQTTTVVLQEKHGCDVGESAGEAVDIFSGLLSRAVR